MKVSIIIPNYNGEELLKKNLDAVFVACTFFKQETKNDFEIIVVDDASADNSWKYLERLKDEKRKYHFNIYKNDINRGFSPTVNFGVKKANGEIVVLLNTDVSPSENFLIPLVTHFGNQKVFAVGCLDKSIAGGETVERGRGIGRWERGFLVHARGEVNKNTTLWVNGGSGAFRKSIWEELGGFNELYSPFYWEDIDLSYRAQKSGYEVVFEKESVVIHEHEKGAIKNRFDRLSIKTIAYRNQFIFVWENATDFDLQLSHITWLPYHFAKALVRVDGAFFVGFLQAFILLPKIIQSNSKLKKLFVRSDKEVIKRLLE